MGRRVLITLGIGIGIALAWSVPSRAQGVQTGTISGLVQSVDGVPLPGVTVTAVSSALQGDRGAVTDVNGFYALRALPPGAYAVRFAIDAFQPTRREGVAVSVGGSTRVSATMSLETRQETVTVTAEAPTKITSTTIGWTSTSREIDTLPVGRRPVDVAELAPGLTINTFNAGQLSIGGAFGFDNVFMVNGVDTNDNVFGTSNNLFIEDAVQEVSVLTGGIPAAFGRFSGGVVNVVTRSGGNAFSGSVRQNLSNPDWIAETPRERENNISHADILNKSYEATFGGPVLRDRIWFFSAGRHERTAAPNTLAQTGGAYTRTDTNRRGEVKLTATFAPGQMAQTSFISNSTTQANASGLNASLLTDAATLVTRTLPNDLFAATYRGTLRGDLLATAQFSRKRQGFRNNGGTSTEIEASPFRTLGTTAGVPGGLYYHAPYLDATDPENRDNHQVTGSLAYLLSTKRSGSHDLQGGVEHFVSTAVGGNSQSSTGYVFVTDYLAQSGKPVVDSAGSPIPVFVPGVSQVWNFVATRGATLDLKTTSLYFQDQWMATPRLTMDLGARVEVVRGAATGGIRPVSASSISPRLGMAFDVRGNGRTIAQASYSMYSGKYSQTQFAANTSVGRPSEVDSVYTGPAGQGSDFAPGFDVSNYTTVVFANVPTANVRFADDIQSPVVREFSLALGQSFGKSSQAKVTYVSRRTSQFVEDFADLSTGVTTVPNVGTLTNRVFANTSEPTRRYDSLMLEAERRFGARIAVNGHYTVQLLNRGSFVGEAAGQPGIPSILGNFPEIFGPALDRLMPEGRMDNYQRHKLRVYAVFTQPLGRVGGLDVSPIWRVNSGTVYSLSASLPLPAEQLARNPGYPANDVNSSVRETVFFGERGQYSFKGYGVLDLAMTYRVPVWRSVAPWVKAEIYNTLNNQKLIAWDKTVTVDRASATDANGIPTGYTQGPRFGQATTDNQFPQPYPGQNGGRAFRVAFGVRM
jgi:hypothetical protein